MILIAIPACAVILSVLHIVIAARKSRKIPLMLNIVFCAVLALAVSVGFAEHASVVRDSEVYDIDGDELFSEIKYVRTEDDCFVFSKSYFISGPSEFDIPKGDLKIPAVSHVYKYVLIYEDENSETVKIRPYFSVLCMLGGGVLVLLSIPANIGMLIFCTVKDKKQQG